MKKKILLTGFYRGLTGDNIKQMMAWGILLILGGLTVRVLWDFFSIMIDPEQGLKAAWQKSYKRIFAVIIAICVESLIIYFSKFYQ